MRPLTLAILLVSLPFVFSQAAASSNLQDCADLPSSEWPACAEQRFGSRGPSTSELRVLDERVESHPAAILEFLQWLEKRFGEAPAFRAGLLDRQAEAHRRLGQAAREAELRMAALELDPGTRALTWWSPGGKRAWVVELDNVTHRHVRAARALLATDRRAEARSLLVAALRLGDDDQASRLWAETGGGPVDGLDAQARTILARPWYPRLPWARVQLVEGEPFVLSNARGQVLILDFWASWCEPCLKELPSLGELYRSERERGVQVILINMGEAPEHAQRFVRGLGLDMPVGIYDDALADAFDVATIPAVIVADRDGRVRGRWDGYGEGVEKEVTDLARRLLEPVPAELGAQVGSAIRGGELLEVEWARVVKGGIDGLAVARLDGPHEPATLVVLAGRFMLRYDARGISVGHVDRPRGAGLLRSGDLDGNGIDDFFSFRPGGTRVTRLEPIRGEHSEWESPNAILDLAIVPTVDEAGVGSVFLATTGGLLRRNGDELSVPIAGISGPTGLAAVSGPDSSGLAVISSDRGLCQLDPRVLDGAVCVGEAQGWRVVNGLNGEGIGSLPRGSAAVSGRFLGGEEGEVAVATSSGQLVVLDIATGRERYRARLEGLSALAAGDLDGDGIEELVLGVREHILVLRAALASADHPMGDPAKTNKKQ